MMFVKRFCMLARSFPPLQPSSFNTASTIASSKRCDSLKLCSSFAPEKQENKVLPANSNEEDDPKLKFFQIEISLLHERGAKVPDISSIKKYHWDELLKMESKNARRKYYNYLFATEKAKKNKALKRQQKIEARELQQALDPPPKNQIVDYTLQGTTFFLRIGNEVTKLWRNERLRRSMQFAEKLVFDCSYDEHMTNHEARSTGQQLTLSFAANRKSRQPFDLHFCNVNFGGETMKQMERTVPSLRQNEFPINLYEGSYLDLFPRNQLIYLTPHCRSVLTDYDPDMVYIIGAMVDKRNREPLSLAKAKKLNLQMARLPLNNYLNFGCSSGKSSTLDQMMRIMLDLKNTRN